MGPTQTSFSALEGLPLPSMDFVVTWSQSSARYSSSTLVEKMLPHRVEASVSSSGKERTLDLTAENTKDSGGQGPQSYQFIDPDIVTSSLTVPFFPNQSRDVGIVTHLAPQLSLLSSCWRKETLYM